MGVTHHPGALLLATAFMLPFLPHALRRLLQVFGSFLAIVAAFNLPYGRSFSETFMGLHLVMFHVDWLSHVFGIILALAAFIGCVYAWHLDDRLETPACLVYAGGALGVVYAGDWFTLLFCWEVMALASLVVVWRGGRPGSPSAGLRYVLVHACGGLLFFTGILILYSQTFDLSVRSLVENGTSGVGIAFWFILLGVSINAAIPPFHAWLPDAYPEASVTGTIFLSAFTTKTAVYVLVRVFPGTEILIWAGVVMALYGVVFAVLENDIRRLLAYHIVSQVGYMVVGVGIGTTLSLNGTVSHAFCHILYKSLLLMGAGAVLYSTGRSKLTELGGLGKRMPLVLLLYAVGACSISGVPLFNGFISKSMVISGASQAGWPWVEILLLLASIGTFLHTGLKLLYFTFLGEDCGAEAREIPQNMIIAMGIGATYCTLLGIHPAWLYSRLDWAGGAVYHPFSPDHLIFSIQLLTGTAVGFWVLISKLGGEATVTIDTDWLYRRPLRWAVSWTVVRVADAGLLINMISIVLKNAVWSHLANPVRFLAPLGLHPGGSSYEVAPGEDFDSDRDRFPIAVNILWMLAIAVVALGYLMGVAP